MDLTSRKFKGSFDFLRNSQDRSSAQSSAAAVPNNAPSTVESHGDEGGLLPEIVLSELAIHGKLATGAICDLVGVEPGPMAELLRKLQTDQIVENIGKVESPEFRLTPAGERAVRYAKMVKA
jgi:hypothetical protein